jgi:hypothetical protein
MKIRFGRSLSLIYDYFIFEWLGLPLTRDEEFQFIPQLVYRFLPLGDESAEFIDGLYHATPIFSLPVAMIPRAFLLLSPQSILNQPFLLYGLQYF